jgi:hypothetical protein
MVSVNLKFIGVTWEITAKTFIKTLGIKFSFYIDIDDFSKCCFQINTRSDKPKVCVFSKTTSFAILAPLKKGKIVYSVAGEILLGIVITKCAV